MKRSKSKRSADIRQSNVSFNTPMKLLMQRRAMALAAKPKVPIPERQTYRVLLDGADVTPKTLIPPTFKHTEETTPSPSQPTEVTSTSGVYMTQNIFNTQLHQQTIMGESTFGYGTMGTAAQSFTVARAGGKRYESDGDIENPDTIESAFLEPLQTKETLPNTISLTLVETPMIYLFEKISSVVETDSQDAPAVLKANEFYTYITQGKGRNRKVLNAEAQTNDSVLKSRSTKPVARARRNVESFASGWDMLDTLKAIEDASKPKSQPAEEDLRPEVQEKKLKDALENKDSSAPNQDDNDADHQMQNLCNSTNFQNAVLILERILDGNYFKVEQTRVRGLIKPDPFRNEIDYNYRLERLWNFRNEDVYDRPVLSVCWNPINDDVVAVGYGKFFFSEKKHGMVCLWNIKNPSQPERAYKFPVPVTGVNFSRVHPNLLGIVFYDGTVKVIDVIETKISVIASTTRTTTFSHEPLWGLAWVAGKNAYTNKIEESLVVAGREGTVCSYKQGKTVDLLGVILMHVSRKEGEIKGIKTLRKCEVNPLPIALMPSITCLCLVPYDNSLYYIGTDEGTIHKGSKYYLNQHLEVFLAHNGEVTTIEYSPFCNRLFLTSGADWSIRIWAEGIFEPLVTLQVPLLSIEKAAWSPSLSTVVVGVCGNEIYMWDIRKKSYLPASITKSPSDARITNISFTRSGRNLMIGDVEGNLNFYCLEDMPFPPFYQANALTHALRKVLIVRPDLLKSLKKLGNLNIADKNLVIDDNDWSSKYVEK